MAAQIKIIIKSNGDTTFDVSGVEGATCETLTEALIRATGEIKEKTYKEEYARESTEPVYLEDL